LAERRGIRVLFVGNSLTYFNDLPGTLAGLAIVTGDTIRAVPRGLLRSRTI